MCMAIDIRPAAAFFCEIARKIGKAAQAVTTSTE